MKNPFSSFYHVPDSKELLDIAFGRAMKSSAQVSKNAPILLKAKKKELKRIKVAIDELVERILTIIKSVPIIDDLPDFYRELASLLIDVDELRLNLGKLNGILPILSKLEREYSKKLSQIEAPKDADRIRRSAFGRISSIIDKQNANLDYLNSVRGRLREIPSIDDKLHCIVVAGYPNVGKSSFVRQISTNKKIEVQEYPFTTKKLIMGHFDVEKQFEKIKIQFLDTPGILDRPMSKRNNIELQAILALRLISDLIIFIFDPTPACGYSIESQLDLYHEVKNNFTREGKIDIVIIFNKMDLASESEVEFLRDQLKIKEEEYFLVNALSGENLDLVESYLSTRYGKYE
ncbi:MAG: NOG1 family protein [Candidatus Hermodarchaeota archaeon]